MVVTPIQPKAKTPRVPRKPTPPPYYVSISTIEDLGKHYTEEYMKEVERLCSRTNRQSSKNIKGSLEAVWPLNLEAALLEGLEEYAREYGGQEMDRRLKRPLYRNEYISDYIFRKTNAKRGKRQLLLRRPVLQAPAEPLTSTCPLITAPDDVCGQKSLRLPITVTSRSARYPSLPPELTLGSSEQQQRIQLRTLEEWQPLTNMLRGMDPTVVLLSPIPLSSYSIFEVFRDKKHCWTSLSSLEPNGIHNGSWKYATSVAAELWKDIANNLFSAETDRREYNRDNAFAEVVYKFEPQNDKALDLEVACNCRAQTSTEDASIPQARFPQMWYLPHIRTADSAFLAGFSVFSTSGTFSKESTVPGAVRPSRAQSMSAIDVYSKSGTFGQDSIVSMGSNTTTAQHTRAHQSAEYSKAKESDAATRSESMPPFSSSLADWDKLDPVPRRKCEAAATTSYYPQACHTSFYSNTAYFHNRDAGHHINSITGASPRFATVDDGIALNIEELSRVTSAYTLNGEWMGCYPVHDY
ncbi:hypothetical protein DFH09DRAFT_1276643 [Mycena vulgaris]|nr:hypothetical protein DFH09DRAFT_1297006 [Mycena vulgaris]KAJ6576726.1 hypothetical protein DFH09DRAFT_1276643 [Mycena vulgaris]